jgi:hypothetical protein
MNRTMLNLKCYQLQYPATALAKLARALNLYKLLTLDKNHAMLFNTHGLGAHQPSWMGTAVYHLMGF